MTRELDIKTAIARQKHNCDPMLRVYEKMLKIRDREKDKDQEKFKEKEKDKPKRISDKPAREPAKDRTEAISRILLEGMKTSHKIRNKWIQLQSRYQLEDVPSFEEQKQELLDETNEDMKNIWFKFVGSQLLEDDIQKDYRILIENYGGKNKNELLEEMEENADDLAGFHESFASTVKGSAKQPQGQAVERSQSKGPTSKPVTKRDIVEAKALLRMAKDMKYQDKVRQMGTSIAGEKAALLLLQRCRAAKTIRSRQSQAKLSESVHRESQLKVKMPGEDRSVGSTGTADVLSESLETEAQKTSTAVDAEEKKEVSSDSSSISGSEITSSASKIDSKTSSSTVSVHSDYSYKSLSADELDDEDEEYLDDNFVEGAPEKLILDEEFDDLSESDESWAEDETEKRKKREKRFPVKPDDVISICSDQDPLCKKKTSTEMICDTYERLKETSLEKQKRIMKNAEFEAKMKERLRVIDSDEIVAKVHEESEYVEEEGHEEKGEEEEKGTEGKAEVDEDEKDMPDQEFTKCLEDLENEEELMHIEGEICDEEECEEEQLYGEEEEEEEHSEEEMLGEEASEKKIIIRVDKPEEEQEEKEEVDDGDVGRLSETKTESIKESVKDEQEIAYPKEEISMSVPPTPSQGKGRYFNAAFPELFASDASIFPSYTALKLPYSLVCAARIRNRLLSYKTMFRNELQSLERRHPFAFGGVQLARQFIIGIRVPKRFEDPCTTKERNRIEYLLQNKITLS